MLRSLHSTLLLLPLVLGKTITLSNAVYDGPITAESVSVAGKFDMPKLTPGANATTYDWWYFDAVSNDGRSSVTVVLFNAGPKGFVNPFLGGSLSAQINGVFPNGSLYQLDVPATSAVISNGKDNQGIATSGEFTGSGVQWKGVDVGNDGKTSYLVSIDTPTIKGTVSLKGRSPAHYPCVPDARSHASEVMLPNVYWSNAVPDASAKVDLTINGTALHFVGAGYHDKNWGDIPFVTATSAWYWGHANFGPYSIVWFDALDLKGKEYVSGYVAKDGKVLAGSCEKGAVVVRPWGANSEFPPKVGTGVMQGLGLKFDLGDGKRLVANVTTTAVVVDVGTYVRTLGTVEGGIQDGKHRGEKFEGVSLFEEFKFIL